MFCDPFYISQKQRHVFGLSSVEDEFANRPSLCFFTDLYRIGTPFTFKITHILCDIKICC